jgi:hypothetical protein
VTSGMKLAIAFLSALCLTAADPPLPGLRVEPAPHGSVLYVRNVYSQPLAAFLIELVDYPGSRFSNATNEVAGEGIPSGIEKPIPVSNMLIGAVSAEYVKVQAALYTDGSASGNPEKIKLLIAQRRSRLETARELIHRIEMAQSSGTSKPAIVDSLKQWSESLQPLKQAIERAVIAHAIRDVEQQSVETALANLKRAEQAIASSKPTLP